MSVATAARESAAAARTCGPRGAVPGLPAPDPGRQAGRVLQSLPGDIPQLRAPSAARAPSR